MHEKMAAFWGAAPQIERVWGKGRRESVAARTRLYPGIVTHDILTSETLAPEIADTQVVFSTWGMPPLSAEELARFPRLEAVFYAAGTVQWFARPFLERGVAVYSAWQSNAVPVAEFTLAQILLSFKGYFRNVRQCETYQGRSGHPFRGPGVYGETVALLGAGAIGRRVIELLRPFNLRIVVFDPFLPEERARELGVERVSLDEAFARGLVVSNHLANKPETRHLIGEEQFRRMRDGATFVNTGRGATVDETALVAELRRRPDLTALLDVTDPEPPLPDSPLYVLPNAHLTSHIAGSIGDEVLRMADAMLDAFEAFERGEPSETRVSDEMLDYMA
ncbi:MAG TPA: hydroxyacid dehydrogenase [Armatimonadaceae bacterium]|nr:hydroxyacid dehydrogenase [Armatimonadaceae bacterium]